MSPEIVISLLGSNFTIASLVLIYHLFALQNWLTKTEEVSDDAYSAATTKASTDMTLVFFRIRCERQLENFPFADVVLLGALLLLLSVLAVTQAISIRTLAPLHVTIGPTIVMLAAFVIGTYLNWRRGRLKLQEALSVLPAKS